MENLKDIVLKFKVENEISDVKPLGEGLINDTFKVYIKGEESPKYVLQRINNAIFQDVELLQDNIEKVTNHIRKKLEANHVADVERKVLRFVRTNDDKKFYFDGEKYWRLMAFISDSYTYQSVTPEYSYTAGLAFGEFQSMLSDIDQELGETIPSFHNIELRLNQLREAVEKDAVGRAKEVQYYIDEIEKRAEAMCLGEQLHREGPRAAVPERNGKKLPDGQLLFQLGFRLLPVFLKFTACGFGFRRFSCFFRLARFFGASCLFCLTRFFCTACGFFGFRFCAGFGFALHPPDTTDKAGALFHKFALGILKGDAIGLFDHNSQSSFSSCQPST